MVELEILVVFTDATMWIWRNRMNRYRCTEEVVFPNFPFCSWEENERSSWHGTIYKQHIWLEISRWQTDVSFHACFDFPSLSSNHVINILSISQVINYN